MAIVTGAGSGIGRATARRFAAEGACVVVADLDDTRGQEVEAEIKADGVGDGLFVHTDVSEASSVEAMVTAAVERFGRLDVLHNNAVATGVTDGTVVDIDLDHWWRAINVNLNGVFLGCRFAIPAMIESGGGSIINMASLAGVIGISGRDAYSATKGGVIALTRSVAKNFVGQNIRVNAIAPGLVATEGVKDVLPPGVEEAMGAIKGVPQLAAPADIADACVFLASEESRFMTAAVVRIDGGVSSMLQLG